MRDCGAISVARSTRCAQINSIMRWFGIEICNSAAREKKNHLAALFPPQTRLTCFHIALILSIDVAAAAAAAVDKESLAAPETNLKIDEKRRGIVDAISGTKVG